MVREVVPQVEQRVHVPAEGEHPRVGRDRRRAAEVAVDADQVNGAAHVAPPGVGPDPRLQPARQLREPVLAAEPYVGQPGEVREHAECLDVVTEVARRQDRIRRAVVDDRDRDRARRHGRSPIREPALDQLERVATPIVQLERRPRPDRGDELPGAGSLVEREKAPGQGDERRGVMIVARVADLERPEPRARVRRGERRVDRFDRDEPPRHRRIEALDDRPGARELAAAMEQDRVADRRGVGAARQSGEALGERPRRVEVEALGERRDRRDGGSFERLAAGDRLREPRVAANLRGRARRGIGRSGRRGRGARSGRRRELRAGDQPPQLRPDPPPDAADCPASRLGPADLAEEVAQPRRQARRGRRHLAIVTALRGHRPAPVPPRSPPARQDPGVAANPE